MVRLFSLRVAIVALLTTSPAICPLGRADDWPTWRHDRLRTGVTSERIDPPLEQVWAFHSRQARLAPKPQHSPHHAKYPWLTWYTLPIAAAGDALFFNSAADGRTVCLDGATGKVRWEFVAGAAVNRTPMIWQRKVYVGSDDGHAYCLNAETGAVVWKFKATPADRWFLAYGKPVSVWPVRTDVLVDDGVAYFGAGVFPHDGTFLYAVDARTGRLLWRNGTQCETGWRASMSPAGHLFVTRKSIWVPKDCWGYFLNWGTLVSFDRATGGPMRTGPDKDEVPEWPSLSSSFWPVFGVRTDGVRYFGSHADKIDEQDPNKRTQRWRADVAGRWTDVDSVLSVRYKNPIFFRYDPDLSSVVYAGGLLYHTAFDLDPQQGTGSRIYARDPADGKLLWSAEVAERANQLIVANGRLFAATRQGTIYAFAPKGAKTHGVIEEAVDASASLAGDGPAPAVTARTIIEQTDKKAGYALVVDCTDGGLALELAKQTNLYVVAVFRDASQAAAARGVYARSGLHVSRIVAYHQAAGTKLPFPSFFADLIVSEAAAGGGALPQDTESLSRMLKPIRGVALIGGKQSEAALKEWIVTTKQTDWSIVKGSNVSAKRIRPRLEEAGGWFHAYGDAGHSNCSRDAALKPPLGVLWYGAPHLEQGSGSPAGGARVVDGVLLLPEGTTLIGYDQYTGRELWRREQSNTDAVAAPGSVFLRYLEVVVRLDPATGKTLQEYRPPYTGGKWTAMAADRDGKTLYLAAGTEHLAAGTEQWNCILAIDVADGKPRWTLGGPGKEKQWGAFSAIGNAYIYFVEGSAEDAVREETIAEMRAYLKADDPKRLEKFEEELDQHEFRTFTTVDAKTGKVLYTHGMDATNCGGKWLPGVGYGSGKYARHYNPLVGGCTIAQDDVVIFCTASGADKGWQQWPAGAYAQRSIAVHDGATGKLLWKKPADYRTRPVVVDKTIYAEPWAYDLYTGKRKTRVHPITGKQADWAWCRSDKQCGIFAASKHFLFGRSLGVGYHDLLSDQGLYTFYHSRMSCSFDAVSGGGLMIKPPMAVYCQCSWSLPFTVAMGQVSTQPTVGQSFAQPGPAVPVKHLYVDFGASGDRRDVQGNLWLKPQRVEGHKLLLGLGLTATMYPNGEDVRRNSLYTPIENTEVPFVFATAARGMKQCVIPVKTAADGAAVFKVRLGFAALPGDKPGQRVFDVKLNGKTVLKDFDVVQQTGGTDVAVWKEFTLDIDENLVLSLVAKSDQPTAEQAPLINGLVIRQQER
ncbi:MAG: PQQ-binding-like beta-propeller repeat protein [Candidatus Nealsonbacteria bacterium]|nr:PQQ-binding-like beta-propeller repeat protein [Candidatus Nealsonbacteria bacterium]